MVSTSTRLEHITWSLIREFATTPPKKLGRKWLDTPFSEFVPSARRRAVFFRRLQTTIPAMKAPVAELISERFLTPGHLLRRFTGEIGFKGSRPAKRRAVASKKAAFKKAAPRRAAVKKTARRKAAPRKVAAKKAAPKKAAPSKSAKAPLAGLGAEGKSA